MEFRLVQCSTYDDLDSSNYPGWQTLVDWGVSQEEDLFGTTADGTLFTAYPKISGILQEFNDQCSKLKTDYGWSDVPNLFYLGGKVKTCNDGNYPLLAFGYRTNACETWSFDFAALAGDKYPLLLVRPL